MREIQMRSSFTKKEVYLMLKEFTNSDNPIFKGEVKEDSFSMMKLSFFSNNVLNPQIDASLTESEDGTLISVKPTLNKHDKIGFAVMSVFVFCIIIFFVIKAVALKSVEPIFPIVAVFGFATIIIGISIAIFYIKLQKVIKTLKKELLVKSHEGSNP